MSKSKPYINPEESGKAIQRVGKNKRRRGGKKHGSGGIRTHAIEMTGALNQRLRPLGHATGQRTAAATNDLITTHYIPTDIIIPKVKCHMQPDIDDVT